MNDASCYRIQITGPPWTPPRSSWSPEIWPSGTPKSLEPSVFALATTTVTNNRCVLHLPCLCNTKKQHSKQHVSFLWMGNYKVFNYMERSTTGEKHRWWPHLVNFAYLTEASHNCPDRHTTGGREQLRKDVGSSQVANILCWKGWARPRTAVRSRPDKHVPATWRRVSAWKHIIPPSSRDLNKAEESSVIRGQYQRGRCHSRYLLGCFYQSQQHPPHHIPRRKRKRPNFRDILYLNSSLINIFCTTIRKNKIAKLKKKTIKALSIATYWAANEPGLIILIDSLQCHTSATEPLGHFCKQ